MSDLSSKVAVTVTVADKAVTQAGFGTPMIVGYHDHFSDIVRTYTSTTAMVADGFTAGEGIYLAAAAFFAQSPNGGTIKVGKRTNTVAQQIKFTPTAANSTTYTIVTTNQDGTADTASFTSDDTATVAEICTGIVAAFGATDATLSDDTTHVTFTNDTDGEYFAVRAYTNNPSDGTSPLWTRDEETADAGIAADLNAILAEDADFYFLIGADVQDGAGIAAAASWCNTNSKMGLFSTPDEDVVTSGSSDVAGVLAAAAYNYAGIIHHREPGDHPEAAWCGLASAYNPGQITWAYKTLSGVTVQNYTSTQTGYMDTDKCNYYQSLGGVSSTYPGKLSSGRFIDVQRTIDWITASLQEDIYSLLVNSLKVPFTEEGLGAIEAVIRGVLAEGIVNGAISNDPGSKPSVTMPALSSISTADKAARLLDGISVTATLAGAVHTVDIDVYLSV